MKRLKNETTIIDTSTGEVLTTHKEFSIKVKQDEFVMLYIKSIACLFEIPQGKELYTFILLSTMAEYNSGEVNISSAKRKKVCEQLKITTTQFSNHLKTLNKLGLITGTKGLYYINPEIFWKGENSVRTEYLKSKSLKVTLNFEKEDGK
jgi:hypothetical protein